MRIVRTVEEAGTLGDCVLVPTMGFLHEGHASLIRQGVAHAARRGLPGGCVVSIFVNPSQFNDPSDFARYPRELDRDVAVCEACGAQAVFVPDEAEMYPSVSVAPWVPVPAVGREPRLEEVGRPGHFEGVCRVLDRLFRVVPARAAVFGEKDYQQLCLARALVEQQGLATEIIAGATVREADGLAMSSRNVHLSEAGRERARALSRALRASRGCATPGHAERVMWEILWGAGIARIEYASVRRADTLMAFAPGQWERVPGRALVCAFVDGTRLLDNMSWGVSASEG